MAGAVPGGGGGFFKDGPTIAGHKISWAAIGGIAAVVGVFLVLRARSSGSNVASVGSAPLTVGALPTTSGVIDPNLLGGVGAAGSDVSGQLETLSQQVGSLQETIANPATSGPMATLIPGTGQTTIPLYTTTSLQNAPYVDVPPGQVQIAGAPIAEPGNPWGGGQYKVNFQGQTYYANAANVGQVSG